MIEKVLSIDNTEVMAAPRPNRPKSKSALLKEKKNKVLELSISVTVDPYINGLVTSLIGGGEKANVLVIFPTSYPHTHTHTHIHTYIHTYIHT